MPQITKELALKIAKKLKATTKERKNKAHDIACVFEDSKLIAQFGIRRGSKKNLGHDHIPNNLFITTQQTKQLGKCPLSREEWIRIITEKGKV